MVILPLLVIDENSLTQLAFPFLDIGFSEKTRIILSNISANAAFLKFDEKIFEFYFFEELIKNPFHRQ